MSAFRIAIDRFRDATTSAPGRKDLLISQRSTKPPAACWWPLIGRGRVRSLNGDENFSIPVTGGADAAGTSGHKLTRHNRQ